MIDEAKTTGGTDLAALNAPGDLGKGIVRLHPWQERFFRDPARVTLAIWHRQAGKDFAAAAKAVDDAFRTGRDWYIVSLTQRQADATFDKAKRIAECFKRLLKRKGEVTLDAHDYNEWDAEIKENFRQTARTLCLPGGGTVTALPGRNPDTLAGLTGSVIFTEFGLMPRGGYDHWRVIFPLSTRGYQVLVISTPRGKNTKLYDLQANREDYSVHVQTILDSVREGFMLYDNAGRPTTVETFKRLYGDDAGWTREYMCEFTGDLEALLKWGQLEAAGADGPGEFEVYEITRGAGWRADLFANLAVGRGERLEIGWDVARRGNLSAVSVNKRLPDQRRRLVRLVLMRDCEFALQRQVLSALMDRSPSAVGAGDATGLGMDSNETLALRYGEKRWRSCTFTQAFKRELASALATAFSDAAQLLPPAADPWKFIHTDLYAIQKEGDDRNLSLLETPNPLLADSHCDVAYSLGLARIAAALASVEMACWTA